MSAIWIILLDTSGSMGEGFGASVGSPPDPLSERGAWATKLDAAKELLLRQVAALRAQDIAVIRFTEHAEKLFQGLRDGLLRAPDVIRKLKPGGGTSIAFALDSVRDDPGFEQYRSFSVLVLTDGLSNPEAATKAAQDLVAKYPFARIDTLLIDETPPGRTVAEAISINGTVRTASSAIQLGTAIAGARIDGLRSELSHMALQRFEAQRELHSFDLLASPTLLTVTAPFSLNAATLKNDVVPTIAGIEAIGRAKSYASRAEFRGSVSSISQDSPISINLTGLKESVELILTYVIPWRRHNAERLAALDVRKSELEVERQERAQAGQELELENSRLRNLRIQLELAESKWKLAEEMLKELDPDSQLRGEARARAMSGLLSGIEHLSSTRLEFDIARELSR